MWRHAPMVTTTLSFQSRSSSGAKRVQRRFSRARCAVGAIVATHRETFIPTCKFDVLNDV